MKQIYYQIETNNIKKEKNFEDFDDDLLDIKPPKLFIESYNNKADNNQLFEIEPKCKNEINILLYFSMKYIIKFSIFSLLTTATFSISLS